MTCLNIFGCLFLKTITKVMVTSIVRVVNSTLSLDLKFEEIEVGRTIEPLSL